MAEPNNPILVVGEFSQIRLDGVNCGVGDGVFLFVEHEFAPNGERTLVARHEFRFFVVHELLAIVVRRLFDALQALPLR